MTIRVEPEGDDLDAAAWARCPQLGPLCGGDDCCCADTHCDESVDANGIVREVARRPEWIGYVQHDPFRFARDVARTAVAAERRRVTREIEAPEWKTALCASLNELVDDEEAVEATGIAVASFLAVVSRGVPEQEETT